MATDADSSGDAGRARSIEESPLSEAGDRPSAAHGMMSAVHGFVVHVAIRVLGDHARAVHPVMYLTAAAFGVYFLIE